MRFPRARTVSHRKSLLMQASVANLVVALILVAVGIWLVLWRQRASFGQQLELRAQASAELLANAERIPAADRRPRRIAACGQFGCGQEDVLYVTIADETGEMLAQAGRKSRGDIERRRGRDSAGED